MPRQNKVTRILGTTSINIVINGVRHTLTEDAFIAFMQQALDVMQSIVASRSKP